MPNPRKSVRKSMRKSVRKSTRKVKTKSVRKSPRKSVRKSKKCQKNISKKIAINIDEFKEGRYVSKSQAIAVAYSQVKKRHPECEKYLTKKFLFYTIRNTLKNFLLSGVLMLL